MRQLKNKMSIRQYKCSLYKKNLKTSLVDGKGGAGRESEIEVIIITVGYFQCTGSFDIKRQKSLYLQETFMYYCCFSCSVMSNSLKTPQTVALGSSAHRISQARVLEWVAISCSRGSFWPRDRTHVSSTAGGFSTTEPPGNMFLYKLCQMPGIIIFHFPVP